MENKIGFFEETPGQESSLRLIFVAGSLWAMALVSYLAWKGVPWEGLLATFTGMMATMGGLKLGQKSMEAKAKKEITEVQ
jgi:hypothetical protein